MTTTVFRGVKADQGAARNEHVAIDDRPADTGVAADAYTGHEDGLIDVTKTVDPHVRAEHAALHAAPGNDAAARDDRIERDRKSTRLNSSHLVISYAVFC